MGSLAHHGTSTVSLKGSVQFSVCRVLPLPDNLQVQWGSQDHYEIVRKVGRGKYSEVCLFCT